MFLLDSPDLPHGSAGIGADIRGKLRGKCGKNHNWQGVGVNKTEL